MDFFHLPFFFFFCLWGPSHFTRNWNGRYPTQNESHRILYCVFIDYKQKYIFFLCIGSNRKGSKINVKLALTFTHIRWHVEIRKC